VSFSCGERPSPWTWSEYRSEPSLAIYLADRTATPGFLGQLTLRAIWAWSGIKPTKNREVICYA
jgi:hypothetical protein